MELVALTALILAFVALRKTRARGALGMRIHALEQQVELLQSRPVAARDSTASAGPPATATQPPATQLPVTPPAPQTPPERTPPRPQVTPSPTAGSQPRAAAPVASAGAGQTPPPSSGGSGPPSPPRPPALPRVQIDWERWVGVRGAAVLGGIVLALAGVYFFQYSIEHGLIPPWLRVATGTLVGLACIVGAEWRARDSFAATANALVGGGIVILYASFYAASSLYGLVDPSISFAGMIAVTGACTALAYRHESLVIALIGLVGGFATPALLSTGEGRPIALFTYILLLDVPLLFMARRRGWPWLALVSLLFTLGYQAIWIVDRLDPAEVGLALGVIGVFALVYAFSLGRVSDSDRREWVITQAGASLLPFLFALLLAAEADFGDHIAPVASLLIVLSASAAWLARAQKRAWLGVGAATGSVTVFAVWMLGHFVDAALAWEVCAFAVLLAALFHLFVELDPETPGSDGPAPAAIGVALGLSALLWHASTENAAPLWPWLAGGLALAGIAMRHGGLPRREWLQVVAALVLSFGLMLYRTDEGGSPLAPSYVAFCIVVLAIAVAGQVAAMLRRGEIARRQGEHAAAAFALTAGLALAVPPAGHPELLLPIMATLLGLLALLAATRLASGPWSLAATAVTALGHTGWVFDHDPVSGPNPGLGLAVLSVSVVVFSAWPFLSPARFRNAPFAWRAAALAGPAWFISLKELYAGVFGVTAMGLLPVALGALSLMGAYRAIQLWPADDPARRRNVVWTLAVALGFGTVAIPLQLDREWITIGWALEGCAVAWLWRRLDHPGLKALAVALFIGTTARLLIDDAVTGTIPRPEWRVVNVLLYSYLVPAAAMIGGALALAPLEVQRARSFEQPLYGRGWPVGAALAGVGAIVAGFLWINLAIADWYTTGSVMSLDFGRMQARDLATSIAWALYALGLLAMGVRTTNGALRWLSLGLMLLTAFKVFLHDLGELDDLYRVASLLGLAVSLIAISLAYQRFVVQPTTVSESG